jgi:hypothetical protein
MKRALPEAVANRPFSCSRTVPTGVPFTNRTGVLDAVVAELAQQVIRHTRVTLHRIGGIALELIAGVNEHILVAAPFVIEETIGHQRVLVIEIKLSDALGEAGDDHPIGIASPGGSMNLG